MTRTGGALAGLEAARVTGAPTARENERARLVLRRRTSFGVPRCRACFPPPPLAPPLAADLGGSDRVVVDGALQCARPFPGTQVSPRLSSWLCSSPRSSRSGPALFLRFPLLVIALVHPVSGRALLQHLCTSRSASSTIGPPTASPRESRRTSRDLRRYCRSHAARAEEVLPRL